MSVSSKPSGSNRKAGLLAIVGPGVLVAATGVGAGDLATASFTGSQLGVAVLWAVLVGSFLKFTLNEGLARWQLATGQTLIEGAIGRFGRIVGWLFLPYFLLWSYFVSAALMGACGVTLHAIIPLFSDPERGKIVFGIGASVIGTVLVLSGGFRLFEKIMSVCIGVMFVVAVVTAGLLAPSPAELAQGLFVPSIPNFGDGGLTWTVALIGGIGGTLTILCYGYWIREAGRSGTEDLWMCRIDLGIGYLMTAVFGLAMVIIGNTVETSGSGARLLVTISEQLDVLVGPAGKWLFLVGALGAVFSSLLGVWQAVPYLFADIWRLILRPRGAAAGEPQKVDTRSLPYRAYLLGIATIPMLGLFTSFKEIQKLYAVTGAMFIPCLAAALLVLNGRETWVGRDCRNRPATVVVLLGTLVLFAWIGSLKFAR